MSASAVRPVLIIGYGNPARLDDGLGPALAELFLPLQNTQLTVHSRPQLMIEDAALMSGYGTVIFADAAIDGPEPYRFTAVSEGEGGNVSSHHIDPAVLLQLASTIYQARPACFMLAIRGYAFDGFGEELSPQARVNLTAAASFLDEFLRNLPAQPDDTP